MVEHNIPPFLRYIDVSHLKRAHPKVIEMTKEAYIEMAEKQRMQLSRLATGFLHDTDAAEDVVQESLLRLWLLRERIETAQDFSALAIRITKNVCISLWRQKQKQQTVSLEALNSLENSSQSTDIEDKECQQILQQALSELAPAERRIFQLWQQDLSIQEIATITGAQPRTVSSMLSLTRRKLYTKLKNRNTL